MQRLPVVLQIAQEIHLLEGRAQPPRIGLQLPVSLPVALHEYLEADQPDHLRRSEDILPQFIFRIAVAVQIHAHTSQEGPHQRVVDPVAAHDPAEGMYHRVGADAPLQGAVVFGLELVEQRLPILVEEGVDDLIGDAHESVDPVYGVADLPAQAAHPNRERGAVTTGD